MIRIIALATLLSICATAQTLDFKDTKLYIRTSSNEKPQKQEGVLNLMRDKHLLIFVVKEGRVLRVLSTEAITGMEYRTKGAPVLTIHYKDTSGQGQYVEFELGGNRDAVIQSLQAETGQQVVRVAGR